MTFRVLAIGVLAAGAAILAAALALLGESPGASPAARHLREMKERVLAPERAERITLEDVVALPHGLSLERRALVERRGVTLEGWNQRILVAADGDMHLEITPAPRGPDSPDTAYVTAEVTPLWREGHPGWSYDRLAEVFRPNRGTATRWDGGPNRVRITGWLLYDYQYDSRPTQWSLTHGSCRVSGWEIHPVTRIERWDAARGAWEDVAR